MPSTPEIQDLIEVTKEAARLDQERVAETKALREEMKGWRQVAQRLEWLMFEIKAVRAAITSMVELLGIVLGQDKATRERVQAILEEQASNAKDGLTIQAGRDVEIEGNVEEQ